MKEGEIIDLTKKLQELANSQGTCKTDPRIVKKLPNFGKKSYWSQLD